MKKLYVILLAGIIIFMPGKIWAQDQADEPYFDFDGDNLVMSSDTEGAIIYYNMKEYTTKDEANDLIESLEVNDQSTVYSNPIPITKNVVIKAISVKQGLKNSDIHVLNYYHTAWQELLSAIEYADKLLYRVQNNPDVDEDLKKQLQWAIEEGQHIYRERGWADSFEAEHFTQRIKEVAREIEEIIGTDSTSEPYAVLSDNNTVLTFYYDEKKEERNGMDVGPFEWLYRDDDSMYPSSDWYEHSNSITNVIFDNSFVNCTTITSTAFWFYGCNNLEIITGINNLNTDNVIDMSYMFDGCQNLTGLDVSGFKTSKVTNMRYMFDDCYKLTSLDVSGFETANVTDMHAMFHFCENVSNLNLSNFNTAKVTDMGYMFVNCNKLTNLDLSSFNTESVKTMRYMFGSCDGLINLDLSNFNTDNVTSMWAMFADCSNLINLNINNFNTSNVKDFSDIFTNCSSLASIQAGSANIPAEEYAKVGNPNLLVYVNEARLAPEGVQNVVINGLAKEIKLVDADGNNNFFCPEPFRAERISYTRPFTQRTEIGKSRGWEGIALPFNVQTITHETHGALAPFRGMTDNTKPFWLRAYNGSEMESVERMEAYEPYIISMPNNNIYPSDYIQAGYVTFSAANTEVYETPDYSYMEQEHHHEFMILPAFQRKAQSDRIYAINVGEARGNNPEGSVFERNYREVRPFEVYTIHNGSGARPRFISIAPQSDDETTGIVTVAQSSGDSEPWYTLDGRKLTAQPKAKGVYIHNGKKVIR